MVKNEAITVQYAIQSVVNHVNEIVACVDPTCTDNTLEIVKTMQEKYPDKIRFVDIPRYLRGGRFDKPRVRTAILKKQEGDVLLLLDGDEVYTEDSIKRILFRIKHSPAGVDGWNWHVRYFISKNVYIVDELMTRAARIKSELHFVEYMPPLFKSFPETTWIHEIFALGPNTFASGKVRLVHMDTWHFHFPYLSGPRWYRKEERYEGPYPEVFSKDFDFSVLFPKV